jgi:hypothetical protein
MYIKHISFFLYLRPLRSRNRLQIPGMEPGPPPSSSVVAPLQIPGIDPGSSSLDVAEMPAIDPGSSSSDAAPIPGPPPQMWRRSHARIPCPPPPMPCQFWILLFFPSLTQHPLHWNLSVRFFTFFTFPTRWQQPSSGICLSYTVTTDFLNEAYVPPRTRTRLATHFSRY